MTPEIVHASATREGERAVLTWELSSMEGVVAIVIEVSTAAMGPWIMLPWVGPLIRRYSFTDPRATWFRILPVLRGNSSGVQVGAIPPPAPTTEQADFTKMSSMRDWKHNQLALRPDMFRWDATKAPLHEKSDDVCEAIHQSAGGVWTPTVFARDPTQDWLIPTFLGVAADPATEYGDPWTKAPNVHKPSAGMATETTDESLAIIDVPTGRVVEPSPSGCSVHDLNHGPGYSANSKAPGIPMTGAAVVPGGTAIEAEGSSSARTTPVPLMIRFPELYRADEEPWDAIQHPLHALIQGASFNPTAGMAPRGSVAYGYGIASEPADGRLPHIFPAHQGEVVQNGSKNLYAPPNGCWWSLRLSRAEIEALAVPGYVKAILYALAIRGAFFLDVQGAPGISFRFESPNSYTDLGDVYAAKWLESHNDGTFLYTSPTGWTMDITGGHPELAKLLFSEMEVLAPPPKPEGLSS